MDDHVLMYANKIPHIAIFIMWYSDKVIYLDENALAR